MFRALLLILLCISSKSFADYPVTSDEYVHDFASLLDESVQKSIRDRLRKVDDDKGVEIAVVTLDNYKNFKTNDNSWEVFSKNLFNSGGIGNLPRKNGILFLISKEDRKIRIEFGTGYPESYSDIMKNIIEESIVPLLKLDDYNRGVIAGVEKIIESITISPRYFVELTWSTFAYVGFFISLIIAFKIDKEENPAIFLMLLGSVGLMFIYINRMFSERGTGFDSGGSGSGGGGGGGASGGF